MDFRSPASSTVSSTGLELREPGRRLPRDWFASLPDLSGAGLTDAESPSGGGLPLRPRLCGLFHGIAAAGFPNLCAGEISGQFHRNESNHQLKFGKIN